MQTSRCGGSQHRSGSYQISSLLGVTHDEVGEDPRGGIGMPQGSFVGGGGVTHLQ